MARLSLTLLGSFQTMLDGKPITAFRSNKVQGLLAYLAQTTPQAHPRDALAALFWPEEPETVARQNLRQSLYQLRQVLDETVARPASLLQVSRSSVQFNPAGDYRLDVQAFCNHLENGQLELAASLYRGDLLPGFTCDSLPFEAWLGQERERLHRLALGALFELAARGLARADYAAAQSLAQRQLALEPWREEAHRQLMQALARQGERSAALAQYEACRAALQQELGLAPSAETEALAARIRAQPAERDDRLPPAQGAERRRLAIPFVGRASEHGALVQAFQQAREQGAQVAALVGEAGIGKTRLARNFLGWAAAQGADVLTGQAFEASARLSYQLLAHVFRLRLERENAPEDLLSDFWLAQLTRILPELRDRYPDLPEPTQDDAVGRQHLFEAITRLGQALAQRAPLVIFIDDWHWADAASLDVLHYAALRWRESGAPILVLLTLRQEALAERPELPAWLAQVKHDVGGPQLALAALTSADTEQLIRTLLEPAAAATGTTSPSEAQRAQITSFSGWLFAETDGQPFFLVETLKSLVESSLMQPDPASAAWRVDWARFNQQPAGGGVRVLPGVREIIRAWLARISPPAAELLAAAAVLGQQASFDRLSRVAGLPESQALTALDEVLARQLLLEADDAPDRPGDDPGYRFAHQKLGEVVYAEAGAARRRILHRRALEALQASQAPAAELAHHALKAGLTVESIGYSIAAGNAAMRLFATSVAIAHYETAWQLAEQYTWPAAVSGADRQDLYDQLGRAYELTQAWPRAASMYQAMIDHARTIGAAAMEIQGLNRLATVYIHGIHQPQHAAALLEQARALAEQSGDRRGLAETEWILSMAARVNQDGGQARQHGEQALAIARELRHPQLVARCLNALAYAHAYLRQWNTVEAYASEARGLYARAGNRVLEMDCLRLEGWSQLYRGRPADSRASLQEALAFSQEIDNLWGETECDWRLAGTELELGHLGPAARLARQAARQARQVGQPTMVVLALATWGMVQRRLMRLRPAQMTLEALLAEATEKGLIGFEDWVLEELCAVHASAGEWGPAHAYARRALALRAERAVLPFGLSGWTETEALLRGGDDGQARAELERQERLIGDNRRSRLPWLRSKAVLAEWDGQPDQAVAHLEAAAALAQAMGLPGEEWPILSALGTLYFGRGDRAEAQRAWAAAASILRQLAESIDEDELQADFMAASEVRKVLEPLS